MEVERDLEKEYSPSKWSKRFNGDDKAVLSEHTKFVTEESKRVRQTHKTDLNISYGKNEDELLDVYGVDLSGDAPILVYVHGGYWQAVHKDESAYCVKPLVKSGIKVIVINYSLCPKVTLEAIVAQMRDASRFILEYAGKLGAKSVSFAGHSAGAHLIAAILDDIHHVELIKNIFLISGVYDVTELRDTEAVNKGNLLSISDQNEDILSPMFNNFSALSGRDLQFWYYVGEDESETFKRQSRKMHQHMREWNIKSSYKLVKDYDHFDIVEHLAKDDFQLTKDIVEAVLLGSGKVGCKSG